MKRILSCLVLIFSTASLAAPQDKHYRITTGDIVERNVIYGVPINGQTRSFSFYKNFELKIPSWWNSKISETSFSDYKLQLISKKQNDFRLLDISNF